MTNEPSEITILFCLTLFFRRRDIPTAFQLLFKACSNICQQSFEPEGMYNSDIETFEIGLLHYTSIASPVLMSAR